MTFDDFHRMMTQGLFKSHSGRIGSGRRGVINDYGFEELPEAHGAEGDDAKPAADS